MSKRLKGLREEAPGLVRGELTEQFGEEVDGPRARPLLIRINPKEAQ